MEAVSLYQFVLMGWVFPMESILTEHSSNSLVELKFGPRSVSIPGKLDFVNGFKHVNGFGNPCRDEEIVPASGGNHPEVESPEESETSNSIFKFINEILMEENLEEKNCMLLDCLAKLQEEEKSWYNVLNQKKPPPLLPANSVSEIQGDFSPEVNSSDSSNSCHTLDNGGFEMDGFRDLELPQPGFKPTERVEETGRRLENYCKRFNVEFEYQVIARKWETIQLEDLRLKEDEMTVVNCLYRFKNLADETVFMNSPREAVLKLVRIINPDLFVHGVVNGTYNAPFFVTRFKEASFHFSSLYDMFDVNVEREDQQRLLFEREVFGRDAMIVIACEGFTRVVRPETYKQWQDKDIFSRVKDIVRSEYHKDFIIDQVGHWMLQGWKGRVIYALSCWVPA